MSRLALPKASSRTPFYLLLGVLSLIILASVATYFYRNAQAASLANWNAGRIIDDAVFTNYKTMSASQIQDFLKRKVPTCDTWGTQPSEYGGGTRRQWAEAHGYKAPFTCLKDYSQGGKKASQIIYEAARDFKINPQVLIVLLQKEQGLVTDTWPLSTQYKSATGYGCPDTAPCDSQYYGLTNQIRWSARMFRAIMDASPTWYTPYVLGNNFIQYNPSSSCGGSTVNIRNRATQALYNYTPYQPNQAALAAGWGTAPCGAYGNRNFYLYYHDWFGPSRTPDFRYETLAGSGGGAVLDTNSSSLGDYTSTVTIGKTVSTFYYDSVNKNLRHAYWNGTKWTNQILDGPGASRPDAIGNDVGKHVKALNLNGSLQVYYYDATNGSIRHGWLSGGEWRFETLDGTTASFGKLDSNVGQDITATVYNNQIQLFYYNATDGSLRHAWSDTSGWYFETLDGASGSQGGLTGNVGQDATIVNYYDQLQLYYYDATNGDLRHAWWNGAKWSFEALDGSTTSLGGNNTNVGQDPSVTIYNGKLQLYYYDATNGDLRHAWWNSGWNFEAMDGNAASIMKNDAAVGTKTTLAQLKGVLYVFYYDSTNLAWKTAYWNGNGWYGFNLDGGTNSMSNSSASVGGQLSVANLGGTSLQVFYKNNGGALKHAWMNR